MMTKRNADLYVNYMLTAGVTEQTHEQFHVKNT